MFRSDRPARAACAFKSALSHLVRALCDAHDVLLIAESESPPTSASGKMFACEHPASRLICACKPDVVYSLRRDAYHERIADVSRAAVKPRGGALMHGLTSWQTAGLRSGTRAPQPASHRDLQARADRSAPKASRACASWPPCARCACLARSACSKWSSRSTRRGGSDCSSRAALDPPSVSSHTGSALFDRPDERRSYAALTAFARCRPDKAGLRSSPAHHACDTL